MNESKRKKNIENNKILKFWFLQQTVKQINNNYYFKDKIFRWNKNNMCSIDTTNQDRI